MRVLTKISPPNCQVLVKSRIPNSTLAIPNTESVKPVIFHQSSGEKNPSIQTPSYLAVAKGKIQVAMGEVSYSDSVVLMFWIFILDTVWLD